MPKLYGAPVSPFVRKVMVALAEKGIAHELEPVNPFAAGPEYRKISPLGRIPAYQDGDLTIADSSVILLYLEKAYPTPSLLPSDAPDYARALWFEEYGDGGLGPIIGLKIFRQRIVGPRLFKTPTDETVVKQALTEDLPPMYDYLESQLGSGEGLVGGRFSIGDISVVTQFANLVISGEKVDAARWPKLAGYVDKTLARPSFAAAVVASRKMLGL